MPAFGIVLLAVQAVVFFGSPPSSPSAAAAEEIRSLSFGYTLGSSGDAFVHSVHLRKPIVVLVVDFEVSRADSDDWTPPGSSRRA
jgi:hypothetical protein